MGNLPKPVLRPDLRKLDDLRGKIFRDFSFVKLTRDYLAQLRRDNTRMRVLFARNVDAEYVRIPNVYVVGLLEVPLTKKLARDRMSKWRFKKTYRNSTFLTIILRKNKPSGTFDKASDCLCPLPFRRWDGNSNVVEKAFQLLELWIA